MRSVAVDYKARRFEGAAPQVDIVLDLVGGGTRIRSFAVTKPGGILVSTVSEPTAEDDRSRRVRGVFFHVEVSWERLHKLTFSSTAAS